MIAFLIVAGAMVVMWPDDQPLIDVGVLGFADDVVSAEVSAATASPCSYDSTLRCRRYEFSLEDPTVIPEPLEFPDEAGQPDLKTGDRVFLAVIEFEDGTTDYQYADRDRTPFLLFLVGGFVFIVIILGRWRGVAAIAGLAISLLVLIAFIIPAIIEGQDAVLVAVVGGGGIALVSLYLAHGFTPLTHAAAFGAFAALVITTALAWVSLAAAEFAGLASEEAFYLLSIPNLDLNGLLLAGIVLGAIGALDDVTVTQASAVWEVHSADPGLSQLDLYRSGLRVGRDHIVSTVNTLLLAYAGASLPLLILFTLSAQPFAIVASSEVVATEIVRTVVGSAGLIAAVPITTWVSARLATSRLTDSPADQGG